MEIEKKWKKVRKKCTCLINWKVANKSCNTNRCCKISMLLVEKKGWLKKLEKSQRKNFPVYNSMHRFLKRINSFLCFLNKTQIMFWLNCWLYFTSKIIVSDSVNLMGKYGEFSKVDHLQAEKKPFWRWINNMLNFEVLVTF